MNILFILPKADLGGAENVLNTYVDIGKAQNWDVNTVYFSDLATGKARFLPDIRILRALRKIYAVCRLCKINSNAIIVTTLLHQNIILCVLKAFGLIRNKVIIRETNNYDEQVRFNQSAYFLVCLKLRKIFYSWADRIIILNGDMKQLLGGIWYLKPEKVRVVSNPIRPNLIEANVEDNSDVLNINKRVIDFCTTKSCDSTIFYSVGSLIPQKNFPFLIQGFAADSFNGDKLVIFGDGPERQKLIALIEALGMEHQVLIAGAITNYGAMHRHLDIFISTSHYEGSPNAMSEAITLGKFCVSANYNFGPKTLLADPRHGRLFKAEDRDSFISALEESKTVVQQKYTDDEITCRIFFWNVNSQSELIKAVYFND